MNKVSAATPSRLLANRTRHTRWLVIILIPFLFTIAPPPRADWVGDLMEALGVFCLVVCLVGRVWSSLYIAGRKDSELVVLGPYSVVRNPLYVFSFFGVIGIGLISEMFTLLAVAIATFAIYYGLVVRREETNIGRLHGAAFERYAASVPRWIPNFTKWRDANSLEVEPRRILMHLVDSSLFFLSFMLFEFLEFLRSAHAVKIMLVLP